MLKYESLHNHTTDSDGDLSSLELLKLAEAKGFGTMALTEHDSLPTAECLAELRAYHGPVKWLAGIEISSGLPRELGGGPASMLHILGLFVNVTNSALLAHCQKASEARAERMAKLVDNLQGLGFKVTAEECLEKSQGEAVGRPHIVQALLEHPENLALIEQLRQRMETAAKSDPGVARRYQAMMVSTQESGSIWQQPFTLFLSDDSFIPGVYVDYTYWVDLDKSVELIRAAGGVAIIAHWPLAASKIDLALLTDLVNTGRLDGVEVCSGFTAAKMPELTAQLELLAAETGCLTTIGIDLHSAADIDEFMAQPGLADQTIGQTQRLIDRVKPDLTYSNLG